MSEGGLLPLAGRMKYTRPFLLEFLPAEKYPLAKKYIEDTARNVGVKIYSWVDSIFDGHENMDKSMKTKAQFEKEVEKLKKQIEQLEKLESKYRLAKEAL